MPALTVTYNVCSDVKPLERNFNRWYLFGRTEYMDGWLVGCSGGSHRKICVVSNTTASKTRMSRSENKKIIHYSVAAAYYKYSQKKSSSHEFLFFIYKVLTPTSSSSLLSIFLIVDTMDVTYIEITRMPSRWQRCQQFGNRNHNAQVVVFV